MHVAQQVFFLIIKTCLNSTCILHQIVLTVPLLLPRLTLNGWEKKLKIKKRVAWYSSSTVQNIVVAHQVLRIIQLGVKPSSVAPLCVCVCQMWNSWSEKLKEQNKNQASKQNNFPANNKRIKNTNQSRQKCSLLTPQHNRIRISWICRLISFTLPTTKHSTDIRLCYRHLSFVHFVASRLSTIRKGRMNIEGRWIQFGSSAS